MDEGEDRSDGTPASRLWTRRAVLSGSVAAIVGISGFAGASPDRPDEYYGRNHETHATAAGDFRLHASSTAWSLTDEAPVEVTTRQYVEPTRQGVTVERIVVRSELEVGTTSRFRTVPYNSVAEAAAGFVSYRVEFQAYPYWSVRHTVTATINTASGPVQLDVNYAHGGEALGTLE